MDDIYADMTFCRLTLTGALDWTKSPRTLCGSFIFTHHRQITDLRNRW